MDAAGIGAGELATRLHAARATVYHWRKGTRIPSPDLHDKLAHQLGVSVAELNGFGGGK